MRAQKASAALYRQRGQSEAMVRCSGGLRADEVYRWFLMTDVSWNISAIGPNGGAVSSPETLLQIARPATRVRISVMS